MLSVSVHAFIKCNGLKIQKCCEVLTPQRMRSKLYLRDRIGPVARPKYRFVNNKNIVLVSFIKHKTCHFGVVLELLVDVDYEYVT